jgi:hypothetical protein
MGRTAWITLDTKTAGYTTWPAMAADAPAVLRRPTVERKLARLLPRSHRGHRGLPTPVTCAPNALASCTPNDPTPPAAPMIGTFCPAWTSPSSEDPGGGEPEDGDGRSLLEAEVGRLVAKWSSPTHGYSA